MRRADKELYKAALTYGVRLGEVLHVKSMATDDLLPEPLNQFIEDYVLNDEWLHVVGLEKHCPSLSDYEFADAAAVAMHLARYLKAPFICRVEFQIVTWHSRGKKFPLGTRSAGWSHYQGVWVAAFTPEVALDIGIAAAEKHWRERWKSAPMEGGL